jgi:hypothetical protein
VSITVTLPYDPNWTALTWAKEHCPGYITNKADRSRPIINGWGLPEYGNTVYYFISEEDAFMFKLKWGGE